MIRSRHAQEDNKLNFLNNQHVSLLGVGVNF